MLPSHTFNDFLGHHHHWMEWLGATIDIDGFSMVLRSGNHWFQWFTMVVHHRSNNGMVTNHRWSLAQCKFLVTSAQCKSLVTSAQCKSLTTNILWTLFQRQFDTYSELWYIYSKIIFLKEFFIWETFLFLSSSLPELTKGVAPTIFLSPRMSSDHWLAYNWSCTAYSWNASPPPPPMSSSLQLPQPPPKHCHPIQQQSSLGPRWNQTQLSSHLASKCCKCCLFAHPPVSKFVK